MVKDFTKIGRISSPPDDDSTNDSVQPNAGDRRVLLLAIKLAASVFFIAGVWLVLGFPSPLPPSISLYLGIAFIVSTVADLIVIRLIKRAWAMKKSQ